MQLSVHLEVTPRFSLNAVPQARIGIPAAYNEIGYRRKTGLNMCTTTVEQAP